MTDKRLNFEFGANSPAHRLATILQALEDCERAKADYMADYKARKETLDQLAWKLRCEILSGQMTLVPEPEPEPEKKGDAA